MAVEWDRVGQPGFDRIVESLVQRRYDETARVEAVSGRGGDGGIDIKVTQGSRLRIFQLKYYPDGFPAAGFKGRRPSIRKSFERAMRHAPWEWALVVPCTLSPGERDFVMSLAADQAVRVEVWDRAKLDCLMAAHPDLEASFKRDHLREAARDYNQERALLLGGLPDLNARVAALGKQVDGLDDHWTLDFAREGDTVVHTLRAKHPRAHEVSPVQVTFTPKGPLPPEVADSVRRGLGFGLPESVVLSPEVVDELTVTGPEWMAGTYRTIEVRWQPAEAVRPPEVAVEVVFLNGRQVLATYAGTISHLGRGSIGWSVSVDLGGGSLTLLLPETSDAAATLEFDFAMERLLPAAALRMLSVHRRLAAGVSFEIRSSAGLLGQGTMPPRPDEAGDDLAEVLGFVEDWEVVQRHCEQHFPVPLQMRADERLALRMTRLIIEGHTVVSLFTPTAHATLNGEDNPTLRALLEGEPHQIMGVNENLTVTLAGRQFPLGPAWLFHPHVSADMGDARRAVTALNAGRGDGEQVCLRPANGEYFRLVLQRSADGMDRPPAPLGLPGLIEPR
ncbi:hypothetical protein [Streptomyces sp. NPDC059575]|uniref:hypothetical protein n=1 Tax=Streptomyces sp. NPDC059575 TaxID=3346872 RepID=UPI003685CDE3